MNWLPGAIRTPLMFARLMEAAGWQPAGKFRWERDGLVVIGRYVYLAYRWTGELPAWAV